MSKDTFYASQSACEAAYRIWLLAFPDRTGIYCLPRMPGCSFFVVFSPRWIVSQSFAKPSISI